MIILRCLRVYCKLVVLLVEIAVTEYLIPKALKSPGMVERMRLAENDEFETYDSIWKLNSILKIK